MEAGRPRGLCIPCAAHARPLAPGRRGPARRPLHRGRRPLRPGECASLMHIASCQRIRVPLGRPGHFAGVEARADRNEQEPPRVRHTHTSPGRRVPNHPATATAQTAAKLAYHLARWTSSPPPLLRKRQASSDKLGTVSVGSTRAAASKLPYCVHAPRLGRFPRCGDSTTGDRGPLFSCTEPHQSLSILHTRERCLSQLLCSGTQAVP